mgnify:CR=1 FL=1
MTSIDIKRGDKTVTFKGELLLAPSEQNTLPFRMLCKSFGAAGAFTKPIATKNDLVTSPQETPLIAALVQAKYLNDLENNKDISALSLDMTTLSKEDCKKIAEKTTKPLIAKITPQSQIHLAKKDISAIYLEFIKEGKEQPIDHKFVEMLKHDYNVPIIVRSKVEVPEDIYSILKKTEGNMVAIGDLAFSQPVIFEQTNNYFEKGYYNKITRKRREKEVSALEEVWDEFGEEYSDDEKQKLIDIFLEE